MKYTDRFLQDWRIKKALAHISPQSEVLDIGCFDALMFQKLGNNLLYGIGIDPLVQEQKTEKYELIRGFFPDALPNGKTFDAITLLAVLEHIPATVMDSFSKACFEYLKPNGKLIITVPDAKVDHILEVLKFFRLIHGMSLEEHYGFDVSQTPDIFTQAGFSLLRHETFQLGLNNLFVFQKTEKKTILN